MATGSPLMVPFLSHHLSGVATGVAHGVLTREAEYLLNSRGPSLIPTVEELMRLYFSGFFNYSTHPRTNFAAFAVRHGADFSPSHRVAAQGEERRRLWDGILELNQPRYPEAFLRHLWRYATAKGSDNTGVLETLLRDKLRVAGFHSQDEQQRYMDEREALSMQDLLKLFKLGLLDWVTFLQECTVTGLSTEDIDRVSLSRLFEPGPREVLTAAAGHNWDSAFARRWQLDRGKPAEWDTWARRAGLDCPADTGTYGHGVISPADAAARQEGGEANTGDVASDVLTWGDMLWRDHWITPTLGDLARFLHRYRGDPASNDGSTYSVPGVRPLTLDEANAFMDRAGIPNGLKTYYYNLMYEPPNKREMHAFIHMGATNAVEVAGWLMDNGMKPDIAQRAAVVMFAEEAERQEAPIKAMRDQAWKEYVRGVEKAYEEGAVDRTTAEAGLLSNGVPADVVKVKLDTIELDAHTGVIQAVIARTRADWFAGRTDEIEARLRLGRAGVPDPRINVLVATWKAQRGQGHQLAGTDKVLRWYRKGYLNRGQVIQRLSNLEWNRPDMLLLLAEIETEMKRDAANVIASLEKDKEHQVKDAEATLRNMMGNVDKIVSHLRRIRPKGDVLRWYAEGRIAEDEARRTLLMQGYDTEAVDNFLIDALDKKKAKKSTKKGANGATANVPAK